MKKRFRERILVLLVSISVLLSSTGAFSVLAQTVNASEDDGITVSSSSTEAAATTSVTEQETTTAASENEQKDTTEKEPKEEEKPNVVSDGGEVKSDSLKGEGTTESPYQITSADDLFKMQSIVNDTSTADKYFILKNDIDLSSVSYAQLKANTVAPGTILSVDKSLSSAAPNKAKFTLNGRGFKIYGLNINNTGSAAAAVFGYVSANSLIKYVNFENITITVSSDTAAVNSAIALYNNGEIRDCTFKNITVNVTKTADADPASASVSKNFKSDAATGLVAVNAGKLSDQFHSPIHFLNTQHL